jgi:hypothetical protein
MSAEIRADAAEQSGENGAKVRVEPRPMKPGLELRGKHPVGRDPRRMTPEEIKAAGHEPMSPLQAIRAHCLDCCVHQEKEVALCTAVNCPSWPFRTGTDPWRKPASPARREAARRAITALNARQREKGRAGVPARPAEHGTAPHLAEGSGEVPIWDTARADQARKPEQDRRDYEAGAKVNEDLGGERASEVVP